MLTVRSFLAPKKGDEADDCQDSIYACPTEEINGDVAVFAVSDGTTTSFFSRTWANILTRRFRENAALAFDRWDEWLREAQMEWQTTLEETVKSGNANFFVINGFRSRKPAAATFLGLWIDRPNDAQVDWRALILGDSCLIILPSNGQPSMMNIQKSADFGSVVEAAESWPKENPHTPTLHNSRSGGSASKIVEHDSIILASDAFSKWLLLRHEKGRPVWGSILGLAGESEFKTLVGNARSETEDPLENDDVALIILKFGEAHIAYQNQIFEPTSVTLEPSQSSASKESKLPLNTAFSPERSAHVTDSGAKSQRHPNSKSSIFRQLAITITIALLSSVVAWLSLKFRNAEERELKLQSELANAVHGKMRAESQIRQYAGTLEQIQLDASSSVQSKQSEIAELKQTLAAQRAKDAWQRREDKEIIQQLRSENAELNSRLKQQAAQALPLPNTVEGGGNSAR